MSLVGVRDEFLARRVQAGDGVAFGELVRRYEPLIASATRWLPDGLDGEDARQAALLGLLAACRMTDGQRRLAGLVKLNVQWRVTRACRQARNAQRLATVPAHAHDDGPDGALAWLPAPDSAEPARVVELREQMRVQPAAVRRAMTRPAGYRCPRYGPGTPRTGARAVRHRRKPSASRDGGRRLAEPDARVAD